VCGLRRTRPDAGRHAGRPPDATVAVAPGAIVRRRARHVPDSHWFASVVEAVPRVLPREGVHLRAVPALARRADGSCARWAAYRVRTGRCEAASGLTWDSVFAITDLRRS
jgi:hypothetical protein